MGIMYNDLTNCKVKYFNVIITPSEPNELNLNNELNLII